MPSELAPHSPNPLEQRTPMEKTPHVEHLLFGPNKTYVLIKTTFPRESSSAVSYILITAPTEEGEKKAQELVDTAEEPEKSIRQETWELISKPLVFKGHEQAQEWFDMIKYNFSKKERASIASFLSLTDDPEDW